MRCRQVAKEKWAEESERVEIFVASEEVIRTQIQSRRRPRLVSIKHDAFASKQPIEQQTELRDREQCDFDELRCYGKQKAEL